MDNFILFLVIRVVDLDGLLVPRAGEGGGWERDWLSDGRWRIFLVSPRSDVTDQSQPQEVVLDVDVGAVWVQLAVISVTLDTESKEQV